MHAIDGMACAKRGCDNRGKLGLTIVGPGSFPTKWGRRWRYRCTVSRGRVVGFPLRRQPNPPRPRGPTSRTAALVLVPARRRESARLPTSGTAATVRADTQQHGQ